MTFFLTGLSLSIPYTSEVKAVEIIEEPEPVEIVVEWTEERIIEEIQAVFPEVPLMVKVAKCEGRVNGKLDPNAYNPTNGSGDSGIFQISTKYHGERVNELGLDMTDPEENIKFARILYDESGLGPWIHSKHCWSK